MSNNPLLNTILEAYGQATAFKLLDPDGCEDPMSLYEELKAAKETGLQLERTLYKAIVMMKSGS